MRPRDLLLLSVAGTVSATTAHADPRCLGDVDKVQPKEGVIPDQSLATVVGRAYLEPIYGKAVIDRELPLRATLKGGVWTVVGSRPKNQRIFLGGLAEIKLCQSNGRALSITHYK